MKKIIVTTIALAGVGLVAFLMWKYATPNVLEYISYCDVRDE
jgi:hypothetical protein